MKKKISIIKLGHVGRYFDMRVIQKWKSELFEVVSVQCVEHMPKANVCDSYLDQKYDREQLAEMIKCPTGSDLAIGIMPYRFVDNFYLHRVGSNCAVLSLYGIKDILREGSISIENFILKQVYEIVAISLMFDDISTDEIYDVVHADTRGCLFDLNGDKTDILYNTEMPILCDSCKGNIKKSQMETGLIEVLNNELHKIKKPIIVSVEKWIKKYPLVSILVAGLSAISLNLIASGLYDILKVVSQYITTAIEKLV